MDDKRVLDPQIVKIVDDLRGEVARFHDRVIAKEMLAALDEACLNYQSGDLWFNPSPYGFLLMPLDEKPQEPDCIFVTRITFTENADGSRDAHLAGYCKIENCGQCAKTN